MVGKVVVDQGIKMPGPRGLGVRVLELVGRSPPASKTISERPFFFPCGEASKLGAPFSARIGDLPALQLLGFFRDDVDDAALGVRAVDGGGGTFHDFNAVNFIE